MTFLAATRHLLDPAHLLRDGRELLVRVVVLLVGVVLGLRPLAPVP